MFQQVVCKPSCEDQTRLACLLLPSVWKRADLAPPDIIYNPLEEPPTQNVTPRANKRATIRAESGRPSPPGWRETARTKREWEGLLKSAFLFNGVLRKAGGASRPKRCECQPPVLLLVLAMFEYAHTWAAPMPRRRPSCPVTLRLIEGGTLAAWNNAGGALG